MYLLKPFVRRNVPVNPSLKCTRRMATIAKRLEHIPIESVFTEFTSLSIKLNAINLGQGFPDYPAEQFVLKATSDAVLNNLVQYTRSRGHPRLVNNLSKTYKNIFKRDIDPLTEILITPGASGGLFAATQAIINPGDEVILIEPFYDAYPMHVRIADGIPVYVSLKPTGSGNSSKDWKLDFDQLKNAITPKTKAIMLNNPQNVPGKVYSLEELNQIAELVKKHNLYVINDAVYEWLVYDNIKLDYISELPGMYERTINIGSAGKSFSVTGFKVGWCIAPPSLIDEMYKIIQVIPFSVSTPLQEGIAVALEQADQYDYLNRFKTSMQLKRDYLVTTLIEAGLDPIVPEGSYFILANTKRVPENLFYNPYSKSPKDYHFCRWITENIGVAAIPPSAFYSAENQILIKDYARFAFCKKDEVLQEARIRFQQANLTK